MVLSYRGKKESLFSRFSVVAKIILVTSVVSFFAFFTPDALKYLALQPNLFLAGTYPWTLATHVLVHGNGFHLLVNMFFLFSLGSFCERLIGRKRFLWLYIIAGLVAGLTFVAAAFSGSMTGWTRVLGDVQIPGVGASGALFGVLGVLATLIPRKRVLLLGGPLVFLLLDTVLVPFAPAFAAGTLHVVLSVLVLMSLFALFVPGRFWNTLAMPIAMQLWVAPFVALVPLIALSFFFDLPFGNSAHAGGLAVGLLLGWYLRFKYRAKVRLLGRMFQ